MIYTTLTVNLFPFILLSLAIVIYMLLTRKRTAWQRIGYTKLEKLALLILIIIMIVPSFILLWIVVQPTTYEMSGVVATIVTFGAVLSYISLIGLGKKSDLLR